MTFLKSYTKFFKSRTDNCATEAHLYVKGLLQAKRGAKNIERMVEHVEGFTYQNVNHAIANSPWDHRELMDHIAQQADGLLGGGARARLIADDTGFQKKGDRSVGVTRQYIGRLGKVENCQIAVCTSLASGQRSMLTDVRLYLPEVWTKDAARCAKAGIPEDQRHFRTKSQILLESVRHQRSLGLRFDVVNMDSGYGSDNGLLHALDQDHETFVAEVHCDQHVWTAAPWHHQEGRRKPLKEPRATLPSVRVDELIKSIPDTEWKRLKVRNSDQGSVEINYLAVRVHVAKNGDSKVWWLLAWENPDERCNKGHKGPRAPTMHYALSNAPADEDERVLLADAVQRNSVERDFRDAKSELGMADYQVRGWAAWHHHMALVMLAMLFITQEKMHSPSVDTTEGEVRITAGDLTFALERMLPQRGYGMAKQAEVERMLSKRLTQRARDQERRRKQTREERPALWPDEEFS
jgi:SRSO17 transposase